MKQGLNILLFGLLTACGGDQSSHQTPAKDNAQNKTVAYTLAQALDQARIQGQAIIQDLAQTRILSQAKDQDQALTQVKVQNQALSKALAKALAKARDQNQILTQFKVKNLALSQALAHSNATSQAKIQDQVLSEVKKADDHALDIDVSSFKDVCENNASNNVILDGYSNRIEGYPYDSAHLVIYRLNFSDKRLNWPTLNEDLCKTKAYYKKQSYDQFDISWEVITVNLTETTNQFDRSGTYYEWIKLMHKVVEKSGVDPEEPGGNRIVMIASPKINNYGSVAQYSFINIFDTRKGAGVIAHEMAHAMGLAHAQAIEGGSSVIPFYEDPKQHYACSNHQTDDQRSHCEAEKKTVLQYYGNIYSMMGICSNSLEEFNLLYKKFFNWLDLDQDVPLIQTSGKYRIYAYDQGKKPQGPIGLRLKSGNSKYIYWLEHKKSGRYANNAMQGVLINLEGYVNNTIDHKRWKTTSYLLDMTPDSKTPGKNDWWGNDQTDSTLVVGQSYNDHWGGFKITVLQTSAPKKLSDPWVDIDIKIL